AAAVAGDPAGEQRARVAVLGRLRQGRGGGGGGGVAHRGPRTRVDLDFHVVRVERAGVDAGGYAPFTADVHGVGPLSADVVHGHLRPVVQQPPPPLRELARSAQVVRGQIREPCV